MKTGAFLLAAALSAPTFGQTLLQSMRQPWDTMIFVSTLMPREELVALAREAQQARATLVLRGFPSMPADLSGLQRFVAEIDEQCCGIDRASGANTAKVAWMVDPRLFDRYGVNGAPSFVLAASGTANAQDGGSFAIVRGDMALANALKFMAQGSAHPAIREQAKTVYAQAFGGNP